MYDLSGNLSIKLLYLHFYFSTFVHIDYDKHEKLMDCTLGIEQLQESPLYRKQFQQSTPVSKYREASSEKEAKNSPTEDNGIISNSAVCHNVKLLYI